MIKIGDQFKTEFVVTEELYENFIKTQEGSMSQIRWIQDLCRN